MHLIGAKVVLVTTHAQRIVIAPVLERAFAMQIVVPSALATASFGACSGDILRPCTQLDTARRKAWAGLEQFPAVDLSIASEGCLTSDPQMPFNTGLLEVVVMAHRSPPVEVVGHALHPWPWTGTTGQIVKTPIAGLDVAERLGFPTYGVIVVGASQGPISPSSAAVTAKFELVRTSPMRSGRSLTSTARHGSSTTVGRTRTPRGARSFALRPRTSLHD